MKNTLLVAENKSSIELIEQIANLIEKGDPTIKYKISNVKKVKNNKDKYPQIKLGNGAIIDDINQIYFYLLTDNNREQHQGRAGHRNIGMSGGKNRDYYDDYNFDDILESEMGYDNEGRAARREDYDEEPVTRKRRGDEESDDEEYQRIDSNAAMQEINERRGRIKVPEIRKKPKQQEDYEDRRSRPPRSKGKSKKRDDYSDESSDAPDDGKQALEDFYYNEAKSRNRD